jgi:hypothetical protein
MKAAVSREIRGTTYSVTPLGALEGIKVLNRIQRVIAGGAKAEHFVGGVLETLTEADVLYLCDTFKKLTTFSFEGKEPCLKDFFDDHFTSNYAALVEWLAFCLEINFESLFTLAGEFGMKFSPAKLTDASPAGKSGAA